MGSFNPDCFNIFEIYKNYCDIVSGNDHVSSKERLAMFSKTLDCIGLTRDSILRGLSKLMSCLDFSVASRQFNCLYDFAFFICRKNGQKNITVQRAVAAWQIVLNGRFRLLNQWCNFVEIKLLGQTLYYLLMTGSSQQALGEEYCDILQVTIAGDDEGRVRSGKVEGVCLQAQE